jgi:hypothetical protein
MKILGWVLFLIGVAAVLLCGICATPYGEMEYHLISEEVREGVIVTVIFLAFFNTVMFFVLRKEMLIAFFASVFLTFITYGLTYDSGLVYYSLLDTTLLVLIISYTMGGGMMIALISGKELKKIFYP